MIIGPNGVAFLTRISGKLIYGTIILGAMYGTLTDPLPPSRQVIIILVLSLYGVSLASNYAASIDHDMRARQTTSFTAQWVTLFKPSWLMASLVVPVFFFGLSALGLLSQSYANTLTRYGLVIILVFFGFVARRISGGSIPRALLSAGILAGLGYVVVLLKVWTKDLPFLG